MCGIFLIFSKTGQYSFDQINDIKNNFSKMKHRGPDDTEIIIAYDCIMGFHRLAINDLSKNGMQPFVKNHGYKTYTMCNGEIYNYDELLLENSEFKNQLKSHSDCEILPFLYDKYGFDEAISLIDGVFATFYLTFSTLFVSSDKIGVKPVFFAENDNLFAIASEAKSLDQLFNVNEIQRLTPGTILTFNLIDHTKDIKKYWSVYDNQNDRIFDDFEKATSKIQSLLINAVKKRMTSDREIGCLLSGGLDSSIIAAILSREMKKQNKKLTTFSVGFPGSSDIKFARKVAEFIDSDHHEYIISYDEALREIPNVIKMIETYDTTTIRASTPMFMLCKWINKNFPHKVIFSGEGSDELMESYLYFHNAPNAEEGHLESLRLVDQLYKYDVLRSDRCTSGNGLEFREPFLDHVFVDYVTRLNSEHKIPKNGMEKTILRLAFKDYLPECVVWRQKEAFSDGVTNCTVKPWYKFIQEYAEKQEINDYGGTTENNFFKTVFYSYFKNYDPKIDLWLPKWVNKDILDNQEPSATAIKSVYKFEEN